MIIRASGLTTSQNCWIHGRNRLILQNFVDDLAANVGRVEVDGVFTWIERLHEVHSEC